MRRKAGAAIVGVLVQHGVKAAMEPKLDATGERHQLVVFKSLFLGNCSSMVFEMSTHPPELDVKPSDYKDASWIQSMVYFYGYTNGQPAKVLLPNTCTSGPPPSTRRRREVTRCPCGGGALELDLGGMRDGEEVGERKKTREKYDTWGSLDYNIWRSMTR